ncbi:NIF-domain-containing protein [Cylindrobasidium torrendii FP15055 ss-10]|uniref:NIF-domain-containing protein n=1 Tax=Cylindrobasidium torrendii FP15055 ss-10 TaxID=1314674 RepID=A0A0D7BT65_9AGAR|nr:NIF-domain-containing protein [Cylindrobasidium torrendii FP15055 ss-10]
MLVPHIQGIKGRPVSTGVITAAGATVVAYTAYKVARDLKLRRTISPIARTARPQAIRLSGSKLKEYERDWFDSVEWAIMFCLPTGGPATRLRRLLRTMNSLAYLSRQFDVVASRTPPSTPTSEHPPSNRDRRRRQSASESPLPRVRTWSAKSLLFAPQRRPQAAGKRSVSSPTGLFTMSDSTETLIQESVPDSENVPGKQQQPQIRVVPKDAVPSLLRRIFFVRVLTLAWDALQAAWISLTGWYPGRRRPTFALKVFRDGKPVANDDDATSASTDESVPSSPPRPPIPRELLMAHRSFTDPIVIPHKPPPIPQTKSDAAAPRPPPRKIPYHLLPKTLVLDLDETLIHSTSRPMPPSTSKWGFFGLNLFTRHKQAPGHVVEVVLGGRSTLYHVYKRPFVDFFLRTVSGWYTLVIFTASMQEYADPVIDWLDAGRGILTNRLFRDSCTQLPNGAYTKDLSIVEGDLSRVCLIDNSPISYTVNEANGIPIEGWTHDLSDEALLDLLPVLDSLRFTSDVRRVLGLRCVGPAMSGP